MLQPFAQTNKSQEGMQPDPEPGEQQHQSIGAGSDQQHKTSCGQPNQTATELETSCPSHGEAVISGRCCRNQGRLSPITLE